MTKHIVSLKKNIYVLAHVIYNYPTGWPKHAYINEYMLREIYSEPPITTLQCFAVFKDNGQNNSASLLH